MLRFAVGLVVFVLCGVLWWFVAPKEPSDVMRVNGRECTIWRC